MPETIKPIRVMQPMPCLNNCKFGRECAQKYKDGTCLPTVNNFFTYILECQPIKLGIENSKLTFILLNPYQKGIIENGEVHYLNTRYIKR